MAVSTDLLHPLMPGVVGVAEMAPVTHAVLVAVTGSV